MTKEEIIEGNNLIAGFMGDEFIQGLIDSQMDERGTDDVLFHSSLDWLEPVVTKIETQWIRLKIENNWLADGNHPTSYTCKFIKGDTGERVAHGHGESIHSCLFDCIVDYVKWYNVNKIN